MHSHPSPRSLQAATRHLAALVGFAVLASAPIPHANAAEPARGKATPVLVMDDVERWKQFADELGDLHTRGQAAPIRQLRDQLDSRPRTRLEPARPGRRTFDPEDLYTRCSDAVVAIGSVYKCNRCPHWHTGNTATGWVIGRNGEIVSNHHVFADSRNTNVVAIGIMTRDGRCFPVQEVLAADARRDIAIVRVDAKGLPSLPVALHEPVGRPISVIAHPAGDLYTFTQGSISRYMRKGVENGVPPVDWMCVTADFAVGSSGGPVLNRNGAVVGMVARTHTISADPQSKAPTTQMVVKMTIPSAAIVDLLESPAPARK